MSVELLITIVGAFGTLALTINAFFLKGIYTKQNEIEIKVVELLTKEKQKTKDIEELKENQKDIFERLNLVERSVLWVT